MSDRSQGLAELSPEKRALLEAMLRQESAESAGIDSFPLSSSQERLWFLDQLLPESRALYNVPAAVRLSGPVDAVALERALIEIARRHEILRSTFTAVGGRPVQSASSSSRPGFARIDLRGLAEAAREDEARRLGLAEARCPFDLARGPMLRASLVLLDSEDFLLILVMHHIVSDGWSTRVLVGELASLYESFAAGEPSRLPALPLQYADFAQWQRQRLAGKALGKQIAYWRQRLAGELPVLEPARDRIRAEHRTYRGRRLAIDLPAELGARVAALAQREGATPFMVALAAFQALLGRYTAQDDILVGTPVANRPRAELAGLVGFFVNTLPLRTDLSGAPSFRELLRRVRTTVFEAFANQEVPFERLVEEIRPERHLDSNPLVQVMLAYQEAPAELPAPAGLGLSWFEIDAGVAKLDLTLELTAEAGGVLRGAFEYDVDLYDDPTIARMADHFARLLSAAVVNPELPLPELPLLGESERWQVAGEWNDTSPWTGETEAPVLPALLAASAAENSDAVAVSQGEESLTYAELSRRAGKLAAHLRRLGVGPDDAVAVLLPSGLDQCVAVRGVLESGAAYLPLDVHAPAERNGFLLRDAGARLAVTAPQLWETVSQDGIVPIDLGETEAELPAIAGRFLAGSAAYVLYTSGSTGRPKGVAVPHDALAHHARTLAALYGLGPEDRVLQLASIGFDVAAEEIFPTWLVGARLVMPAERPVDPADLRFLIERERLTVVNLPASLWREWVVELAREPRDLPSCLRLVVVGSEAVPTESHAAWRSAVGDRVRLLNAYGLTEATITSTLHPMHEPGNPPSVAIVPIGRPLPGVRAHVLDRDGGPVPAGVPGELYLGGRGLARGYLHGPAETAARFVPDPLAFSPGERLLRTGDLARLRADGAIELLGRADDQIKVRGFRIEPAEIEAVLGLHPGIRDSAVGAWDDPHQGRRLVAWIVADQETVPSSRSSRELLAFLRDKLPPHLLPTAFVPVERLPRTASGKVDRRALSSLTPRDGEARTASTPPAAMTPMEEIVAAVWERVLGTAPAGPDDSFFDLGGHSLLAAQAMARLRESIGVDLPLRRIFEAPTVGALAAVAEQALRAGGSTALPPMTPIPRDSALELSFAQERLWFFDRLQPGSALYNMPAALRLRGPLKVSRLVSALRDVARRHEILRSAFPAVAGRPAVVVNPEVDLPLPLVDLSILARELREPAAGGLAEIEARRPFDLSKPPLVRAALLRLGADDHVLLLTLHHAVADGWSFGLLVRDLGELYAEGEPSLPALPVQYADYAYWQRRWLQGEALDAQLAYWRERLRGLRVLDLPTDRPRPPVQTFRGASLPVRLPAQLSETIEGFAKRQGATPFMVLLALFDLLLARYAGQEDVAVGTPMANRDRAEVRDLIGLFLNMLVLRTDLSGDPGFSELLRRARETALGAYTHGDIPFEKLVEELLPERDLSRTPLFQVMLSFQNTPMPELRLPGVTAEPVPASSGVARFDLTLALEPGADGELTGTFEYATDLFDAATVERMARHFEVLAEAALADPLRSGWDLPLLTAGELRQLTEWNDTRLDVSGPTTIHGLFERQAALTPDAVALVFESQALTYGELDHWANRLAQRLRRLGVGPESRVGLYSERSLEMVAGLLGILKAGAAYLPLDPAYPRDRIATVLADAAVTALVVPPGAGPDLAQRVPRVALTRAGEDLAQESPEPPKGGALPDSPAYVIYTSGSTGRPKGVVIPHSNAVHFFAGMDHSLGSEPGTFLALTSIAFDISVLELFWALTRGFRVVLQRNEVEALYAAAPLPGAASGTSERPIDLSLFYFADEGGGGDRYRLLIEGAKFADRHGFAAVWTPERHFHAFGGLYPNPAVTSAAIAAVTERIAIRAGSVVVPLHSPLRVAEEWAVVDNISRGRVAISFASGWHARDFAIAPQSFRRRKELMLESIDTVRRLWRGESVRVLDGEDREIEVEIHPRPIQPELPVWLTAAANPETFEMAGRLGANVLTHLLSQTEDELKQKIDLYRRTWREAGHSGEGHVTLMLHTFVGTEPEAVRETVREPLRNYFRSSVDLLRGMAAGLGMDAGDLRPGELDLLLDRAVERYSESSGLFGTPAACLRTLDRMRALGADEIGCLIDFGVDTDEVLASLRHLDDVRRTSALPAAERDTSVAAQILRHGVTHLQCTPSLARMLVSDARTAAALGSVRTLLLGGEAFPAPLAEELAQVTGARIVNMYGPTETTVWSTTHPVRPGESPIPIGRPIANTEVHVLDDRFWPVPLGVAGELCIGGMGVSRGYLDRPDLTAERFIPDGLGARLGGRVYRTGDRVRRKPDGNLEFLGRLDHQVKVRGYRIELGEVEAVLGEHPGVREAVVVAREDEPGDTYLAAYAVPAAGGGGLRLAVDSARQEELLAGRSRFVLPNGLVVAHLGDLHTRAGYTEIFEDNTYLRHGVTLEDGDCVFDVGANIGFFTLFVHQRCRPSAVFSFEPIPATFDALRTNVELYGLKATPINCGVGDKPGTVEFTFYPGMDGLSGRYADVERDREITRAVILDGLRQRGEATTFSSGELEEMLDRQFRAERYLCELRTVSDLIREHGVERIDLLKIDVERAEVDVLAGIQDEDWERIRQLVLEVDTRENLEAILRLLGEKGYDTVAEDLVTVAPAEGISAVEVSMVYAVRRGQGRPVPVEANPVGLRAFLRERLPDAMVPATITMLDALPLTPNGKVDRRALPLPGAGGRRTATVAYQEPASEAEQRITAIWRELLPADRIGVHDNFFEVGGNSLLLVRVHNRLQEEFGREIPVLELFRNPTVAALAAYLAGEAEARPSGLDEVKSRAEKQAQAIQRSSTRDRQREFMRRKREEGNDV